MKIYKGRWWIPPNDDDALFGLLTCDPDDGLTLELTLMGLPGSHGVWQSHLNIWNDSHEYKPLTFHGKTNDGMAFTLYNGFVKNSSIHSSGSTTVNIYFNQGIRGDCIPSPTELPIHRVYARYYGLEQWLSINPFEVKNEFEPPYRTTVVYEMPEPLNICIDGNRNLVVRWSREGPTKSIVQTDINVSSTPLAGVEYNNPVRIDDAIEDSGAVADLLSLLLASPTSSYDLEFRSPKAKDVIGDKEYDRPLHFMAARLKSKNPTTKWRPNDVLLPLPSIREQLDSIVKEWFQLRDKYLPVIAPYFTSQRFPSSFVNGRFFDIARVAEALHRTLFRDSLRFSNQEAKQIRATIKKSLDESQWKCITDRLNQLNHLSFRERLLELMKRFPELMELIIGDEKAQCDFAKRATDMRNMEAHLLEEDSQVKARGIVHVRLASKLKTLIDAWLLAKLGLSDETVRKAMQGNRRYWFYASNQSWPWNE